MWLFQSCTPPGDEFCIFFQKWTNLLERILGFQNINVFFIFGVFFLQKKTEKWKRSRIPPVILKKLWCFNFFHLFKNFWAFFAKKRRGLASKFFKIGVCRFQKKKKMVCVGLNKKKGVCGSISHDFLRNLAQAVFNFWATDFSDGPKIESGWAKFCKKLQQAGPNFDKTCRLGAQFCAVFVPKPNWISFLYISTTRHRFSYIFHVNITTSRPNLLKKKKKRWVHFWRRQINLQK